MRTKYKIQPLTLVELLISLGILAAVASVTQRVSSALSVLMKPGRKYGKSLIPGTAKMVSAGLYLIWDVYRLL
jgi:hypothetical protein